MLIEGYAVNPLIKWHGVLNGSKERIHVQYYIAFKNVFDLFIFSQR